MSFVRYNKSTAFYSKNNYKEIERKFLISNFPSVKKFDNEGIVHTIYLSIELDSDNNIQKEIRIRRWLDSKIGYHPDVITIKSGGSLIRTEIESNITNPNFFNSYCNNFNSNPIVKDYKIINYQGYHIECNLVDGGTDNAFYYAEVEFNSEEKAMTFVWPFPDVFIKEITNDPEYKMANYWLKTRKRCNSIK